MGRVEFTGNYEDLSTDKGFQFKFYCEKCGNGFMSTYKVNKLGLAASAAEIASSFLGGVFGRAAHGAYEAQRAIGGKAHDEALQEAVDEIKPLFKQCTRCGKYICEKFCWNAKQQLCETCAPDIDEEVSSAQMQAAKEQAMDKARTVDWMKGRDMARQAGAACPKCGAKTQGGKFCPDCGESLVPKPTACPACKAELKGASKFCPECGQKL